ncbi:DinB family protein [Ascidiimonas aurantiaca]|uniref:DinB family protein n=1 Tax=Ascidiimonas aurantiaca TaxID=1685432 RepID=UPI0030EEEC70
MESIIYKTIENRKKVYAITNDLTLEQLTAIPQGFNNNILWNTAHLITVQQQLVYGLSRLPLNIPMSYIKKYGRGSFPDTETTPEEVTEIKNNILKPLEKTLSDYKNGVFKKFTPYETAIKKVIHNVEEASDFSAFHDRLHLERIEKLLVAIRAS